MSELTHLIWSEDFSKGVMFNRLPAKLRCLLITDGTVTDMLMSFFCECIEARKVTISQESLEDVEKQKQQDKMLIKESSLVGVESGTVYSRAISHIDQALMAQFDLNINLNLKSGIGQWLKQQRIESYRLIQQIQLTHHFNDTPMDCVSRRYQIFIHHQPMITITETYPIDLYKS